MTANPLVSVIIPAYNAANYISQAIDSVRAQTYSSLEIIVVNDGSTDQTLAVLARYGTLITVLNQQNSGAAAARNAGLLAARGELIAFLDADDYWWPEKLDIQIRYLKKNTQVGLVYNSWLVLHGDEAVRKPPVAVNPLAIVPAESGWIYHILLHDCIVHTSSVLLRRAIATQVGMFDVGLRRGQDYDYWLRVSRITEIHKLAATLSTYRVHAASITPKAMPVNYEYLVLSRALDLWGRRGPDGRKANWIGTQRVLAMTWSNFGYRHHRAGASRPALAAVVESLRRWPFQTRAWLLLFRCFASFRKGMPASS